MFLIQPNKIPFISIDNVGLDVLVHSPDHNHHVSFASGRLAILPDGHSSHSDRQGQNQTEDRQEDQAKTGVQTIQWQEEQVRNIMDANKNRDSMCRILA